MQIVAVPATGLRWLEVILTERFGHEWLIEPAAQGLILKLKGSEGAVTFDQLVHSFFQSRSDLPLTHWDVEAEGWESVLGASLSAPGAVCLAHPLIERQGINHVIHYDIMGLTYWMLSRQEEVGCSDLDKHGRFPAKSSHAYKHGYLERPIVDEWLHILGQVIQRQWPCIKLKQHQFQIRVSHDVDIPSHYGFYNTKRFIYAVGGDIIKRCDLKSVLFAPWIRFNTKRTLHPQDLYNTFDWIMDVSEQHGLTSAFYFICGGNTTQDADYQPEHPAIRALMRRIHERGHEIGLHPSYSTYQNPEAIVQEAKRLQRICKEEGIEQEVWGGRMHYLRWEHPTTLYGWEQAGMGYDSTLTYADHPGFRCGTCLEYPAFDPVKKKMLNVRLRPLVVMESSVIAEYYMGLGYSKQALETFLTFKESCRKVNGDFTLLWHNSHFTNKQDKRLYQDIIA
ncbi:MAG: polysaccharide deacetylase family protein [Candidatus Electrothrix sp. YB6]